MLAQSLTAAGSIPLIILIVQGAKQANLVNGSTAFLLALGLGLLTGIGLLVQGQDYSGPVIVATTVAGIGAGLSASGIYSGVQTIRSQPQDTAPPLAAGPVGSAQEGDSGQKPAL
jgi:hypothetical protein